MVKDSDLNISPITEINTLLQDLPKTVNNKDHLVFTTSGAVRVNTGRTSE